MINYSDPDLRSWKGAATMRRMIFFRGVVALIPELDLPIL